MNAVRTTASASLIRDVLFGATLVSLLAGCGADTVNPADPNVSASPVYSVPGEEDEFGKMMSDGAQSQVDERPQEAAALAADFAAMTGEHVTAIAAQQMSNIVCMDMKNTPGPEAVKKVAAAIATETGVTVDVMRRVAARAVQYRCPELASK